MASVGIALMLPNGNTRCLLENKSSYTLHDATIFMGGASKDVGDIYPADCFTFRVSGIGQLELGFYLVSESDSSYYCTAKMPIGDITISDKTQIFEAEILGE